jgi:hypothetical protein
VNPRLCRVLLWFGMAAAGLAPFAAAFAIGYLFQTRLSCADLAA